MAYLIISTGRGPVECEIFVLKFIEWMTKHHQTKVISCEEGKYGYLSATISGDENILKNYMGTLQWIWPSQIRKNHKRKNWFITTKLLSENIPVNLDMSKVVYETTRSSGPGGQHVNKTESAVRATYKPLNISVFAQEERSQHQNKKLALARLVDAIDSFNMNKEKDSKNEKWQTHNHLERGNAIKVFKENDL